MKNIDDTYSKSIGSVLFLCQKWNIVPEEVEDMSY